MDNIIYLIAIIFITLSVMVYKYFTGMPSYKCKHKWKEIAYADFNTHDTYLYMCECGKMKKKMMY